MIFHFLSQLLVLLLLCLQNYWKVSFWILLHWPVFSDGFCRHHSLVYALLAWAEIQSKFNAPDKLDLAEEHRLFAKLIVYRELYGNLLINLIEVPLSLKPQLAHPRIHKQGLLQYTCFLWSHHLCLGHFHKAHSLYRLIVVLSPHEENYFFMPNLAWILIIFSRKSPKL